MSKTQSNQTEASLSAEQEIIVEPDSLARSLRNNAYDVLGRPKDKWSRTATHELAGQCYQVCEAYYHGVDEDIRDQLTPQQITFTVNHFLSETGELEISHWFLKHDDGTIIDPTAEQFEAMSVDVPYDQATGRGFVPPSPSKESRVLLDAVQSEEKQ